MKKASLVIKEIQEGTYNDVLKEVYIDESRIEKQPQRSTRREKAIPNATG